MFLLRNIEQRKNTTRKHQTFREILETKLVAVIVHDGKLRWLENVHKMEDDIIEKLPNE